MAKSKTSKPTKTKKTQGSTKTSDPSRIIKSNSAFKRSMVQMDVKHGEKVGVVFDDGTVYIVECP